MNLRVMTVLALLAGALAPTSGRASIVMTAFAGPGSQQGDECTIAESQTVSNFPGALAPQVATYSCANLEGSASSNATAEISSLHAFATAFSRAGLDRGSLGAEDARATANFIGTGVFGGTFSFSGPITVNTEFDARPSRVGAAAIGQVFVNGSLAQECLDTVGCDNTPVVVPLNTFVSFFISLDVDAAVNANGQLEDQTATADASDTYSFIPGGKVFNLPDGVTFNAPDAFIFDNVYLPPTSAVPELSTWTMMLLEFGGVGLAGCWRKTKSVALAARNGQ